MPSASGASGRPSRQAADWLREALYPAIKQAGISNLALARHVLDPRHPAKPPRIQLAPDAPGVRLVLSNAEAA